MKVKNSIKKIGAVAGSAMMVGLTMGSAASLADFPQPFVEDDGTVASQIVVGSSGKVADVVGAVNLAASMGQAAVQTEEQTTSVSGASYGFSATNGATLDTRNDNLYFGDNINDVRQTLTSDHLDVLADTTFTDDAGTKTDMEFYLYPGQQTVQFGKGPFDSGVDPALYVDNPASVGSGAANHLYHLQANFENEIDFTSTDVESQEISLFGKTYTVSPDSTADSLILLGSQEELSLEDGETGTITVGGNDHELEVVAVTSSSPGTAAFRVDGELKQKNEGQSFNLDGQTVRLDTVIQTNSQTSSGLVKFAVGSEEITLKDGEPVEDDDGNDIEGTSVNFQGSDSGTNGLVDELSGIDFYIGAEDDDKPYVMAGESYSHSLFENIEFHFGGLNPNAAEGGDTIGELKFGTTGDDTVNAKVVSSSGDSATIEWATIASQTSASTDTISLANDDDQSIVTLEGADVEEDQYFLTDAGDFAHMWQVSDIDVPTSPTSGADNDEATVDLKDVVSGASIEVDLDEHASTANRYTGSEVIDGQEYYFNIPDGTASPVVVQTTWGANRAASDAGDQTSVSAALDLKSGASLAFYENVNPGYDSSSASVDASVGGSNDYTVTFRLPSTESTAAQDLTVFVDDLDTTNSDGATAAPSGTDIELEYDSGGDATAQTESLTGTAQVGQLYYRAEIASGTGVLNNVGINDDDTTTGGLQVGADGTNDGMWTGPSALVIEPEDNDDAENVFVHTPGDGGDEIDAGGSAAALVYTGTGYNPVTLESNDDVQVEYDMFGTHTWQDTDGQGTMTFHMPEGQAVAGAAFTDNGGDLTAGGSAGSVSYTAVTGMGALPNMARLDSEVTESVRSNNHLILVGGPAVNTLVSDLVDSGDVDMTELADQGSGAMLQVVEDAFTSGKHALVVAGYGAADTRAASRYLANYDAHSDALADAGMSMVLTEADYPSEN